MNYKPPIPAYWWIGNDLSKSWSNFGDELTPFLLNHFSGVGVGWADVSHASVICTGSVLEHIPPFWSGHILGAGKLYPDSRLHLYTNTAKIWALRGPYSASGVPGDYAIGDPGLLADEIVADEVPTRDFDLGVLPHWSDTELVNNPTWFNEKWTTKVITPFDHPLDVVKDIARCKRLVTSSLHGMIVADACQIPRRLEYSKAMDNDGGLFKFRDYSASVHAPLETGKMIEVSRFHVEDRKHELYDALGALGTALRQGN